MYIKYASKKMAVGLLIIYVISIILQLLNDQNRSAR